MDSGLIGLKAVNDFLEQSITLTDVTALQNAFLRTLATLPNLQHYALLDTEQSTPSHYQIWPINDTLSLEISFEDGALNDDEQNDPLRLTVRALVNTLAVQLKSAGMTQQVTLLDHVLMATDDGVWDWDMTTQQANYSPRWKSMPGYAPQEIQNNFSEWERLLHPEDAELATARAQRFFDNPHQEYHATFRLRCKDGTYKWILSRGKVVEWLDAHTPKRIIGTHVDVDREKKLEQQLTEANRHLKHEQDLLLRCGDMAAIGTWHVDLSRHRVFWSAKTKEIHGVSAAYNPELDTAIKFFKPGWSRELIQEKFTACATNGSPYDIELILITTQGQEKWVRAIGIRDPEGGGQLIYGLFQDIDDRVRNLERLAKAQRDAEQASNAKTQFLASMSHEIRTPINGVIGMISQLKHTPLTQRQQHQTDLALASAQSLLGVINEILDISKIESSTVNIESFEFNAEELFSGIAKSVNFSVQDRPVSLYFTMLDHKTHWLIGDKGKLGQIFTNILGNAVKFTEEGKIEARIWSEKVAGSRQIKLFIAVSDTGPGIPRSDQEKVFDRFGQAETAVTRRQGGTGLGLAIAQKLCRLMGGDITLESSPGVGSTFTASALLESTTRAHLETGQKLAGKRILVIGTAQSHLVAITSYLENEAAEVTLELIGPDTGTQRQNASEQSAPTEWQTTPITTYDLVLTTDLPGQPGQTALNQSLNALAAQCNIRWVIVTAPNTHQINDNPDTQHAALVCTTPFAPSDVDKIVSLINLEKHHLADLNQLHHENQYQALLGEHNFRGKCVLLVEDNVINQAVIEGILEELSVTVLLANNGQEAIDCLTAISPDTPSPDLILMDCQMPVLDGYLATQRIRTGAGGQQFANIPIIALTANAMPDDKQKCLNAGMNDYLSKPIETDNLLFSLKPYLSNNTA